MMDSRWPYHDSMCPAHPSIQDGECNCHVAYIEGLQDRIAALERVAEAAVQTLTCLSTMADWHALDDALKAAGYPEDE